MQTPESQSNMTEALVRFLPSGKEVYVLLGTRLVEAASEADLLLDVPCGGEGLCGKCRVMVMSGAAQPTDADRRWFSDAELQAGWRLACQTAVCGPMEVQIPPSSQPAVHHQILMQGECENKPCDFEPDAAAMDTLAVAVDLGTTTLVAALLDRHTGEERAVVSQLNPQTQFGDDVLSRIHYARQNLAGLRRLQQVVMQATDEMIGELCRQADVSRGRIREVVFAGNTTMQQLLCGIDTRSLGEAPFRAAGKKSLTLPAALLGLHVHPQGNGYVMPVIGGFVGGDTVAGILATGMTETDGPALLVDIGTNGEIVLWAGGKLIAAATAAGPAFEGARISCGMRGCTGAIEKVVVNESRLQIHVIGHVAPTGLCGSGLIDAAAELLRHKLLTPQGRLLTPDQLPNDVPADLAERVVVHDEQAAFRLVSAEESGCGRPILLTQRDLRELQLAAGAIRAGIVLLLRRVGLESTNLQHIFIGGGFGNFIRRSNAQRIGLLPGEVEHRRIRYMGNTSLAGARAAALSHQARKVAEELAQRTQHVDLSTDPAFSDVFADAMLFPEM
jgi:uncharacterized 2Fe-2S/4Fe-4S cluster protein (DUF4445 family)